MPDGLGLTLGIVPGKLFDILDYHLYDWPGHGTPEDTCYQYSEQEWMKGDEYAALIQDPGSYWQRTYLPRVFGAMEPFSMLAPWTDLVEIPFTAPFFAGFSAPPVKEMLQEAGRGRRRRHGVAAGGHGGRRQGHGDARHPADGRRRHQGSLRHPRRHHARHARADAGQVPPAGERQGRHGAARAAGDRLGGPLEQHDRQPHRVHPDPQGRRRLHVRRRLQGALLADASRPCSSV